MNEIHRSELKIIKRLGLSDMVCLGLLNSIEKVAVKKFDVQEAKVLSKCSHENVIKLIGICTKEPPFYLITEFQTNGSLLDYLRINPDDQITPTIMSSMSRQVASGMVYLQSIGIIHGKLMASNLMVGSNNDIKICGFDSAKVLVDGQREAISNELLPVRWTAPETALNQKVTFKSDVWSFGVLSFEIFSYGRKPYDHLAANEVLSYVLDGHRLPMPTSCSPDTYNVITSCWEQDPARRPSFKKLEDNLTKLPVIISCVLKSM